MTRKSYSQLSLYNNCPHQWKLRYIDKITESESNIHLVFGTAMIADDEEDYNKKQLYRILMPIWMNVIADTVTSGNPFNLFRIYGQWISDAAEFVRGSDE